MDHIDVDVIEQLIREGRTYQEISDILKEEYPNQRGFSLRSVKRFCTSNGISSVLGIERLRREVSTAVNEVGPTYGRKMITGYLRQKFPGIKFGENRVGEVLRNVNPRAHNRRRNITERLINPIPYRADYFGHKLHIDQNEKLVMYGVTHVIATDGHSRYIVAHTIMPVKNNMLIYKEVYLKSCLSFGMFHQLRVDCGKEFYLTLGIQELFEEMRTRNDIQPYRQTESKKNLPIERFWVEVNARVNYPLKAALVILDNDNWIDMDNEAHKFCVSTVTILVSKIGVSSCVNSWNEHYVRGRGRPSQIKNATNNLAPLQIHDLPDMETAKDIYEEFYEGNINPDSVFGIDPLQNNAELMELRRSEFIRNHNLRAIFGEVANESPRSFQEAILWYIDKTAELFQQTI